MKKFNVVGKIERKVDGFSLVKGKPVYTEDLIKDNPLIVKILRSPHAHAMIKKIEKEEALKIPGVEIILTHEDLPRIPFTKAGQGFPEPSPYDSYILDKKVRYVGDAVAIIAAIDEKTALSAMKKIRVEYEILESILSIEDAMTKKVLIHDEEESSGIWDKNKNIAAHYDMEIGDVEKVLSESEVVVSSTYRAAAQHHTTMEPHISYSYFDQNNRLVIITSTQVPFHLRRVMSRLYNIPIRNIRVIKPRIGGGFGGKQAYHTEQYVTAVTLKTGKSAKLMLTRDEVSRCTNTRHEFIIKVTAGADKNGKLKAIKMEANSNTGAYGEGALTVFMVCGSKTLPLYNKVEAVSFGGNAYYTNMTSAGAYRGYGAAQGIFALDSTLDEMAYKLKMDPLKFKNMNTIKEGETSDVFRIMGEGKEGVDQIMKSCKLDECVEKGKKLFNWNEKFKNKYVDGDKVRGVGCALVMQGSGIPGVDLGAATIKMNEDGSFNLLIGATDLGTGSDTTLAQIAAEELGVSLKKIIVYSSDTDFTPFDKGAYASSTTYVSGNAVIDAAKRVKKQILENAATFMEEVPENLLLENEFVIDKERKNKLSLSELCTKLFYNSNQKQIAATGSFVGDEGPVPYVAGFAEVEVNLKTGKIKLLDYVAYADCGKVINPKGALGQLEGGLMQGIGYAMYEDIIYDKKGKMLTSDFFNYKIPSREDYGTLRCGFVESYEPTGPFGAKSIGEVSLNSPTPAICNAIFNATGIRLRSNPFTAERLFFKLKGGKSNNEN